MKIAILGDTHFGVRNDSMAFHSYARRFYQEIFFPYLKQENIKDVIQVGDLFDRRKFINYQSLYLSRTYFFDEFKKSGIKLTTFPGNHDIFFKNTLMVNSIELLLNEYIIQGSVVVLKNPTTSDFDGIPLDFIPWICKENSEQVSQFIKHTKSQICFGHFEIQGFQMDKDNVCDDGMSREDLKMYDMVMSGHFHQKSTDGHIYYVGAPMEHTWSDYDQERGFHVFDTETRSLTFIPNPFKMHEIVIYDDTKETLESITGKDYSSYSNMYLKVVVEEKKSPVLFDAFIGELYKINPLDVNIVENFIEEEVEVDVDQSEDTVTIIHKCIDGVETDLNKDKLKRLMGDVYKESVYSQDIA
jgi:DNA repair exonuclease SbcCD nuclease subunit